MKPLPDRANIDHLRKQAKALLRAYRAGDPDAVARFGRALPAAAGSSSATIASSGYRLHDAQSCLAREYGFASWANLTSYVDARSASGDGATRLRRWLALVYAGDVTGRPGPPRPAVAARMLRDSPDLAAQSPCAVGDEDALRRIVAADPQWVHRPGGPLHLPPLVAVTHSSLLQIAEFQDRLHRSARVLLAAGADPNQRIGNRVPPATVDRPDDAQPLSALYGAAGVNHDPLLTRMLLDFGADPNDGESLYHALENPECTRLLLQRGARVTGSNALYRAMDLREPAALELLLAHGGDVNEPARDPPLAEWGCPLLWAVRRRSRRHIQVLLAAGADPAARTPAGVSAYSLAMQFGLQDVATLLQAEGLSDEDAFIAACARGDEAAAHQIQAARPDLPASLPARQLRLLPDFVADGSDAAAMLMVRLGWPVAVRGGDWSASALNLAVFRGDAALTDFLLSHGASWREEHGYGDNVSGTLSWASCTEPVIGGDWPGCARALLAHGMPGARPDDADPELVLVEGRRQRFPEEITELMLSAGTSKGQSSGT